jgi:xanthine dehydrogenase iron-sulfur cluster and FAD-binding subunit A
LGSAEVYLTEVAPMSLPSRPTEWLQDTRLVVVSVDPVRRELRVRGAQDSCSELHCGRDTVVVADDETDGSLTTLNPGDIVKVDSSDPQTTRIVVLRRVWEEYASPEL